MHLPIDTHSSLQVLSPKLIELICELFCQADIWKEMIPLICAMVED
jgi:hypothetical protein